MKDSRDVVLEGGSKPKSLRASDLDNVELQPVFNMALATEELSLAARLKS